jgi:hypothetical protein
MPKRIFVSFDVDHDATVKMLFVNQSKHPDTPFEFKDASVKDHLPGDWKDKVRRRFDNIDAVIFLCGEWTHTATGCAHEYEIAVEKKMNYFLLKAYADIICTRPKGAEKETMYRWTWENVDNLLKGYR